MKLVSLKMDLKEIEDQSSVSNEREYPYGTSITIEDEKINELGLEGVGVGKKVRIVAIGEVVAVSKYDAVQNTKSSVEIQIQDMAVEAEAGTDRRDIIAAAFNK